MPSQEELATVPLAGLIEVPEAQEGAGKTYNVPPDQEQRRVITNWRDTSFSRSVWLETCVHGIWSSTDATPTTLLVFRCEFICLKDKSRLKSITIQWKFINTGMDQDGKAANPEIVARGPYVREWNRVDAEEGEENEAGAELGGEGAGVKAGINLKRTTKSSHLQPYFEKVVSGCDYNNIERRYDTVWWRFSQNQKKDLGVTPVFRTAILIRRNGEAKFDGIFEISDFDGGWTYNRVVDWNDFVGKPRNVDDPVHFYPGASPLLPLFEDQAVKEAALGELATMEGMDKKYAWIWGLDVGKE